LRRYPALGDNDALSEDSEIIAIGCLIDQNTCRNQQSSDFMGAYWMDISQRIAPNSRFKPASAMHEASDSQT
jgi:hypothetical protein